MTVSPCSGAGCHSSQAASVLLLEQAVLGQHIFLLGKEPRGWQQRVPATMGWLETVGFSSASVGGGPPIDHWKRKQGSCFPEAIAL